MNNRTKDIVLAGTAFAAGIAAGFALAPINRKENLKALLSQLEEVQAKTRRLNRIMKLQSSKSLRNVSGRVERVRRELKEPIPDLYKATEGLMMSQDDLMHG
ncbi:MAG: hypothetical protein JJU37_04505 [Balneolaceae bacterium]|nr:hypothetical protein [Balneolaceae bacterium]